jgi:hypothetical protein
MAEVHKECSSNYSKAIVTKSKFSLEKQILDLFISKLKKSYNKSSGIIRYKYETLNPVTDEQFFTRLFIVFLKSIFINPIYDYGFYSEGPYEPSRIKVTDIFYKAIQTNVLKEIYKQFTEEQIVHLKNIKLNMQLTILESPVDYIVSEYMVGFSCKDNRLVNFKIPCINCGYKNKVVNIPCGHHVLCKDCSDTRTKCIECQASVIMILSI